MPGAEKQPTKDGYICPNLHVTITEVVDQGNVPPNIVCPQCKEMSRSLGYFINQNFEAAYEWYKPTDADILRLTSTMDKPSANRFIDHVNKGMLCVRDKTKKTDDGVK